MKKIHFNRVIKIVAVITVCAFMSNTILFAMPVQKTVINTDTLQVQSQMFAPITVSPTWEREAQIKAERNAIIVLVVRDEKLAARDINSSIDKWCGAKNKKRVLTLLEDARINDRGETIIDIGFLEQEEGDIPFSLTINASGLDDLMSDPRKKVKMTRLSNKEPSYFQKEVSKPKVILKESGFDPGTYADFILKTVELSEKKLVETSEGKDVIGGLIYDVITGGRTSADNKAEKKSFAKTVFLDRDKGMQDSSLPIFEQGRIDGDNIKKFLKNQKDSLNGQKFHNFTDEEQVIITQASYAVEMVLIKELFGIFVENDKMLEVYDTQTDFGKGLWMPVKRMMREVFLDAGMDDQNFSIVGPVVDKINGMSDEEIISRVETETLHPLNERYIEMFGLKREEVDQTFEEHLNRRVPLEPDYWMRQLLSSKITTLDAGRMLGYVGKNIERFEQAFILLKAIDIIASKKKVTEKGVPNKVSETGFKAGTYNDFILKIKELSEKNLFETKMGRDVLGGLVYDVITGGEVPLDRDERDLFGKTVFLVRDKGMQKSSRHLFEEGRIDVENIRDFLRRYVKRYGGLNFNDFTEEEQGLIKRSIYAVEMMLIKELFGIFVENDKMIEIYAPIKGLSKGSWKEIKASIHAGLLVAGMNREIYDLVAPTVNDINKIPDQEVISRGEEYLLHPLNNTMVTAWGMSINDLDKTFEEHVNRRIPAGDNYIINQMMSTNFSALGMIGLDTLDFLEENPEYFEKAFLLIKIIDIIASRERDMGYRFLKGIKEAKAEERLTKAGTTDTFSALSYEILTGKGASEEGKRIAREIVFGADIGSSLKENIRKFCAENVINIKSIRNFLESKYEILRNIGMEEYSKEEQAFIFRIIHRLEKVFIYELFDMFVENDTIEKLFTEGSDEGYWDETKATMHRELVKTGMDERVYHMISPVIENVNGLTYSDKVKKIEKEIIGSTNDRYESTFGLKKEDLAVTFEGFLGKRITDKSNYSLRQILADGIPCISIIDPDNFDEIEEDLDIFEKVFLMIKAIEELDGLKDKRKKKERKGEKKVVAIHRIAQDIFKGKEGVMDMFSREDLFATGTPVDIVLDTRTVLGTNTFEIEENAKTLAALILVYGGMKNVNFVFTEGLVKNNVEQKKDHLSPIEAASMIKKMVFEMGGRYQLGMEDITLVNTRIKDTVIPTVENEEMSIEIVITSDGELKEAKYKSIPLKENQFPVAVQQGISGDLKNLEAAFAMAFVKTALVVAKRKDEKKDSNEKAILSETIEKVLPKVNDLYETAFGKDMKISREALNNMIYTGGEDKGSGTRLNLAIDLALPPMVSGMVDSIQYLHEKIRDMLRFA